jgi:drug/metabolite transporter (DMT)-like permease
MLFLGNGGVSWSEQYVPSGLASLLIATVPLWLVLLNWAERGGSPPSGLEYLGIAIGLAGVVLLIEPGTVTDADSSAGSFYLMGVIVLLLASGAWAAGSLFSRRGVLPRRPLYATSMMMMCGGTLLLAFSVLLGEPARVSIGSVSLESALALLYLIVFGSLIAFSAYTWLLRVTRPALVGTYAYVNPVVAVLLGWWLADEPVTARTLAGMVVIVGSVILVRRSRTPGSPAARG